MEDFIDELRPFLKEGVIASVEKLEWQNDNDADGVLTLNGQTLRFSISGGDELGAWFNIS